MAALSLLLTLAAATPATPAPAPVAAPLALQDRGRGGASGGRQRRPSRVGGGTPNAEDLREWLKRTARSATAGTRRGRNGLRSVEREALDPLFSGSELGFGPAPEVIDETQLQAWLEICDLNANGWVSFREASEVLGFDRPRFRRFDEDLDGRLGFIEFAAYQKFSTLEGSFSPPEQPTHEMPPRRTPEQLRNAYDLDSDGMLDLEELTSTLGDYGRSDLTPAEIFRTLDGDRTKALDVNELEGLVSVLLVVGLPQDGTNLVNSGPLSREIDELFGAVVPRTGHSNAPPYIAGPVTPFRRLDLNADRRLTVEELQDLLRPLFTPIRVPTVLHTLDLDQDGVLDESEYRKALDPAAR